MIARQYETADREECLHIFDSNTPWYFLPEERIQFEQFLDRLRGPYFVVIDEDDLVGCGGFATGRVSGQADLCWIIVRRDEHGHGVGNFLVTACVSEILALDGCRSVRLETSQHTSQFFERWGFAVVEHVAKGFGPELDRIEMRIVLDDQARKHWVEMITGGLPAPESEQPIPLIESYKEWTANRYNPGHYLGGRLQPHLDQLRTGPRGKRVAGVLLAISAVTATIGFAVSTIDFDGPEVVAGFILAVIMWMAAVRMYRKGSSN
jgi:GNAT superfamily N-acetyltransferase